MQFILTHINTGAQQTFSTKDLLGILGDRINDEIEIKGQRYRISTAFSVDSSGGEGTVPQTWRADWQKLPITIDSNGQIEFVVQVSVADPEGLFLVINGALYDYGQNSAFHIDGEKLFWHGGFNLETTDSMYIKHLTISNQ